MQTNSAGRWQRLLIGRHPKRTVLRLACWVTLSLVVFKLLLLPIRVQGFSMAPTYLDGNINFVNRFSYYHRIPVRGDVVAVLTTETNAVYLKRIVGLPGETVSLSHGRVLIDGRELSESYTRSRIPWELRPVKLNPDEYFIIGDNRPLTIFGVVSTTQIVGKVLF